MEITFYSNMSEKNVIQKSLSENDTFEGVLKEETSVNEPIIIIETTSEIIGYNYCYIDLFGRYYFISDIKSIRQNLWEIHCRIDVLMSFADEILNTYCIIDHSTGENTNEYLTSEIFETLVKDKTDIITFPSGLSETGGYVLITAGG